MLRQKKALRENDIYLSTDGVNFKIFQKANTGFFNGIPKRICYFGGLNKQRINIGIIQEVAEVGFEIWIIGTVRDNLPKMPDNVKFIKSVDHDVLPDYLKQCDCFILPYNINEFTDGIFPAKINECFACGKPIISTPIKNLLQFKDIIIFAENGAGFVESLKSLDKLESREKYNRRIEIAKSFSEEHQFDFFLDLIVKKLNL